MAVQSLTDTGADADGRGRSIDRQSFGVDQLACIPDLAADTHGEVPVRTQVGPRTLDDAASHTQIAHPIGHFRQLHEDPAGMTKGLVHIPQRAGAAETGELDARRTVTLGDVPGLVEKANSDYSMKSCANQGVSA